MDPTAPRFPSRRLLIAAALAAWPAQGLAQPRRVITILGDSITAGYGLPSNAALPVQLQAQMRKLGSSAIIRGAGVSGDTTAGGLARVDFSVQRDTDVCGLIDNAGLVLAFYRDVRGCGEVMALDPATGHRRASRTSREDHDVTLTGDGNYAVAQGPTRVDVFRSDLVRTVEYGKPDVLYLRKHFGG